MLLAIRDCRIDPLRAPTAPAPQGSLPILERGSPRHQTIAFLQPRSSTRRSPLTNGRPSTALEDELAEWVQVGRRSRVLAKRIEGALRESTRQRVQAHASSQQDGRRQTLPPPRLARQRADARWPQCFPRSPSRSWSSSSSPASSRRKTRSRFRGPAFQRIESIEVLARHLPPSTATTSQVDGPASPTTSPSSRPPA